MLVTASIKLGSNQQPTTKQPTITTIWLGFLSSNHWLYLVERIFVRAAEKLLASKPFLGRLHNSPFSRNQRGGDVYVFTQTNPVL